MLFSFLRLVHWHVLSWTKVLRVDHLLASPVPASPALLPPPRNHTPPQLICTRLLYRGLIFCKEYVRRISNWSFFGIYNKRFKSYGLLGGRTCVLMSSYWSHISILQIVLVSWRSRKELSLKIITRRIFYAARVFGLEKIRNLSTSI